MNTYYFTQRLDRIFTIAKSLLNGNESIYPVHVFIGACKEGSSICSELFTYLNIELGEHFIDELIQSYESNKHEKNSIKVKNYNLSMLMNEIISKAAQKMKRYGQLYLNEGHLISTMLEKDKQLISFLGPKRVSEILGFFATPRDLTVNLTNYTRPTKSEENYHIRRANHEDFERLKSFIEIEFGHRWIESIQNGFSVSSNIPIFLAIQDQKIIGFACYDVVRNKKGLFGPMGTSNLVRTKGIGTALLHSCLNEMKTIGYEYGIIGQAGPIEFYEKTCHAKLIPIEVRKNI